MLMRIKGVKPVTVRRGGKVYRYFRHRATGKPIKAEPGTAAFMVEVATLDARAKATEPKPGTWGAMASSYRQSPECLGLAVRTRKDYERVFTYLKPVDDMAIRTLTGAKVYKIRDAAYSKHGRRFSTYVVQVMRLVLEWGKERDLVDGNPAKGVKAIRRPRDMPRANRAWTDEEREAVLERAPAQLRTVIALGMFAGLREGDAIRLPWSAYQGNIIETIAAKTGERLWIPAHYRLRTALENARKISPIIGVNSFGQPWTESGFRASFFKFLRKLEREGKIGGGLTYHGLRHTVGKLVIEAGGETRDVQSILGHRSEVSSEHYSREADMRKRAKATITRMERTERKKLDKQADNSSVVSLSDSTKPLKSNGAQGQN